MKQTLTLLIVLILVIGAMGEKAQAPSLASFSRAVGVIPTGSANTTTRGVPAAGQIWTIRKFAAVVAPDGHLLAAGRGLLLAAGNGVGSNAGQRVIATLFCANEAGNVQHNSDTPGRRDAGGNLVAGVPLDVNGDFAIDAVLDPVVPDTCTSPAMLIRSGGNGSWFAAGLPTPVDADNE